MGCFSLLRRLRAVVRGLDEADLGADPVQAFNAWLREAARSGTRLPEAMTVATVAADGQPSARMMLLKGADERGFRFFTNYGSRKAEMLEQNPRAAMVFHWKELERQVRIEGTVTRLTAEESEAYFASRPRGSRIGAWASRQSKETADRATLEKAFADYKERFAGRDVPLPPFWGGYILAPTRIEFWQGRADRLHDRICFLKELDGWRKTRLEP